MNKNVKLQVDTQEGSALDYIYKRGVGALPAMMTDQSTEAVRPVYMVNQIG